MAQLLITTESIVWQEVPGEVSLAFLVAGCPLRCPGCHSADSWLARGTPLSCADLRQRLQRYQGLISCVLFMGGEWQAEALHALLQTVQEAGLATCLYTGLEKHELPALLLPHLTYLKTGRWQQALGGLSSPASNQQFIDLRTGQTLNHLFWKEENHDSSQRRSA